MQNKSPSPLSQLNDESDHISSINGKIPEKGKGDRGEFESPDAYRLRKAEEPQVDRTSGWGEKLKGIPDCWKLIPCRGNKVPFRVDTGSEKGWNTQPGTDIAGICALNGTVEAVGVFNGKRSGGLLVLDQDGPEACAAFTELSGGRRINELPKTVGRNSGRPGHIAWFYSVPEEDWPTLADRVGAQSEATRQLNEKRKAEGKKLFSDDVEIFWNAGQTVVIGAHPNNKLGKESVFPGEGDGNGFYSWEPGCAPWQCEVAEAPAWLLDLLRQPKTRSVKQSSGFKTPDGFLPDESQNNLKRARNILKNLDPANYCSNTEWKQVVLAAHRTGRDAGDQMALFEEVIEFCAEMPNFDEEEIVNMWNRACERDSKRGDVKFNTLAEFAKAEGYKEDPELLKERDRNAKGVVEDKKADEPLKYSDVLERAVQASIDDDIDEYQRYVALLSSEFRLDSRSIDTRVLRRLTEKTTGKNLEEGEVDVYAVPQYEYLVPGYIVRNEVNHYHGGWAAGKTSTLLGLARCGVEGKGMLEYEGQDIPKFNTIFIQTDSGAARYKRGMEELHMEFDEISPYKMGSPNQRVFTYAAETNQGKKAWKFSPRNMEKLKRWVQKHNAKLVVIDSVKGMMTGSGFDYTNNEHANEIVNQLRDGIAVPLDCSIVLLNHSAVQEGQGAGAKAWSEAAGQVVELGPVYTQGRGKNRTVVPGVKQLYVQKDSLMDKRILVTKLDEGRHVLADPKDFYKNNYDRVLAELTRWYVELGEREWATKKLKEQLYVACDLSPATVERILKQMQMKDGALKKVRHGVYALKNVPA